MPATKHRFRAYVYLLITTVLWGAAFIVVEPALDHTSVFQFLFYRFGIASLIVTPLLFAFVKHATHRSQIWKIIGIELIGVVIYLPLLYEGLARSTAIETSLLGTTSPLFIIFACVIFLREKLSKQEWLGLTISVIGMLLIAILPILNGNIGLTGVSLEGNLLILLANVVGAVYAILIKSQYKKIPPLFAAAVSFWLGAIAFGVLSMFAGKLSLVELFTTAFQDWQQPSIAIASLYMAIFGSIIGLTAYIKGQKLIEASEASLFYYLQPLIYLPLGVLLLGEPLNIYQLIGLGVILLGVGISEGRQSRKK